MGGRGAKSGFINRIPNVEKAVVADGKITDYLLKPGSKHYDEFISVGYSENNPERLKQDILTAVKQNGATSFEPDKYGSRAFEVQMKLGITKKAEFITGWQIDHNSTIPRLTTAYRRGKKK